MPSTPRQTLVIVPALQEEANIASTVREICAALPEACVVVIDDGSTDATGSRAREAGALVARHVVTVGVAAAELTGLTFARRHGFTHVLRLDGDGQHDARSASALLSALQSGADLVVGSRFLGADGTGSTGLRRLGSRLLSMLLTRATGQVVTDPTSGFRGFSTKAVELLTATPLHDYPEPESMLLVARRGLRLQEVGVTMRARTAGTSTLTLFSAGYYMLKVCFAFTLELLRPKE